MTPKWYDEAERIIGTDDEILKVYEGRLEGTFGYLAISKNRILFLHEKGLFRKTVEQVMDMPYSKLGKVNSLTDRSLDLTDDTGKHYTFKTDIIKVAAIEKLIKEHLE